MNCKRCNEILADEYTKVDPDNSMPSITTIEPYYLCNECGKELLMDAQSAREGEE